MRNWWVVQGRLWLAAVVVAILACAIAHADGAKPRFDPKYERKVGEETAAQVDKEYDRVDDKDAVAKLQLIADTIAQHTPRPDVKYEIRLVKEKKPGPEPEVNAFSLPGGIIYVTKGLLSAVQSDHELAGILAHEIAHNCNYDGLVQGERAAKIFRGEMAAVLAAILIGGINNDAWAQVMQAGLLYRTGVLGGYSIEMERRADQNAVQFLLQTPYDPVGLLTFMERLAAQERRNPPGELGIYQTHPLSTERVEYLISALESAGRPINRRHTANWDKPKVEARTINGKRAWAVVFQEEVIFACTPGPPVAVPPKPEAEKPAGSASGVKASSDKTPKAAGQAPAAPSAEAGAPPAASAEPTLEAPVAAARERAQAVAAALTAALADGAQSYSFSTGESEGKPALLANGQPVFVVDPADAELWGVPAAEVARLGYDALRRALARERLRSLY
jgi:Zn-dependent protease with chaperone function